MRLHAIVFALLVLRARAASLPDKTDIEKKLSNVVKEVLDKEQPPTDNNSSEQELIDQANNVKDVENNLRKNPQVADIPVKVIVEDVKPEVRADPDKKEDNEVAPQSEENTEIKREEVDLKNPGPPQRMQHETQNPEHFEDSQQSNVINSHSLNSLWKNSPQYGLIQKDLETLKENFNKQIGELVKSVQNVYDNLPSIKPVAVESEKPVENINLRASIKQDQTGSQGSAPGGGGFQNIFNTWAQQWQESFDRLNQSMTAYFQNQTSQVNNSGSTNTNSGNNWFSFPNGGFNFVNTGNQAEGASSDEQNQNQNQNWFQAGWQNLQNVFTGNNNNNQQQQPAGAQADSPQPAPAQPNRPVLNAIQQAINFFQPNNNQPIPAPQAPEPSKPAEPQPQPSEPQESSNQAESKPDKEQKKPDIPAPQVTTQSGPIKQLIGNNPILQGIAGTVQRITNLNPVKPRDEVKDAGLVDGDVKGGFIGVHDFHKPPARPATGDNNDVSSSGVEAKNEPVDKAPETPQTEPVKEVPVPVIPVKTE